MSVKRVLLRWAAASTLATYEMMGSLYTCSERACWLIHWKVSNWAGSVGGWNFGSGKL